jgi:hypothetical protein
MAAAVVKQAKKKSFASIMARRVKVALKRPKSLEEQLVSLAQKGMLAPAAQEAIASQLARGLAVTFKRGNQVIKQYPDGHVEVLSELQRIPYSQPHVHRP